MAAVLRYDSDLGWLLAGFGYFLFLAFAGALLIILLVGFEDHRVGFLRFDPFRVLLAAAVLILIFAVPLALHH